MDIEIESLRRKLKTAHYALAQTQTQMELHKIRTRQLVMGWKIRIHEADEKLKRQRQERDMELKEITSQLLFFEAQLKKEQSDIQVLLIEKDTIIAQQKNKIRVLETRNAELHQTLREAKRLFPNGLHVSFSSEEPMERGLSWGNSVSGQNSPRVASFTKECRPQNYKSSNYSRESLIIGPDVSSTTSLSRDNSVNDDVFFVFPIEENTNNSAKRSNSTHKQDLNNHMNKMKTGILKENGIMLRSKSLPNCHDANANKGEETLKMSSNIKVVGKKQKADKKQSPVRSQSISESSPRVTGRRENGDPNDSTNISHGFRKNNHLVKSQPNLNRSFDCSLDYSQSDASMNASTVSLELNKSGKKYESTGERIKKAFLRPRDVKKKSKLRARSNSLKENEKDTSHKLSPNKRYFSFAF